MYFCCTEKIIYGKFMQLRDQSKSLSLEDFKLMLKQHDFFDYDWNKKGHGCVNQFEIYSANDINLIKDNSSNLLWQQDGSHVKLNFEQAQKYIEDLNNNIYANFKDWRLPTLKEALSLLKPKKSKDDLFIDPIFDEKQWGIWTSDLVSGKSRAWTVSFSLGSCQGYIFANLNFVRAVRSMG